MFYTSMYILPNTISYVIWFRLLIHHCRDHYGRADDIIAYAQLLAFCSKIPQNKHNYTTTISKRNVLIPGVADDETVS